MSSLLALSLSIGVLGGIATWLALGVASDYMLIWGAFIAWAAYFANGGNTAALKTTVICGIFGVVCASIAAALILNVEVGGFTAPVWVAVTVFGLVYASQVEALASVPTSVLGYAATFGYLLQTPGALSMDSLQGAAILVAGSLIIGAVFGAISGNLAGKLGSD